MEELAFLDGWRKRILEGEGRWVDAAPIEARILRHLDALDSNRALSIELADQWDSPIGETISGVLQGAQPWNRRPSRPPSEDMKERILAGESGAVSRCRMLAETEEPAWVVWAHCVGRSGFPALREAALLQGSERAILGLGALGDIRAVEVLRSIAADPARATVARQALEAIIGGSDEGLIENRRYRNGVLSSPETALTLLAAETTSPWLRMIAAEELSLRYGLPYIDTTQSVEAQRAAISTLRQRIESLSPKLTPGRWYFQGQIVA